MFNGKMKAVTFSFDDGTEQDRHLIELLNRYHVKGTFHLNSGIFGTKCSAEIEGVTVCADRLCKNDIAELYRGHEVAAHTLDHPPLIKAADEEVIRQVEEDRKNLSRICGYEVVGFAYPCRRPNSDERVEKLVRQNTGCRYARSIDFSGRFDLPDNIFHIKPTVYHTNFAEMMKLGRQFAALKPNLPKIFMLMGHSYELDVADRWERLEEFIKFISGRDDIFYGTCRQVYLGTK